MTSTTTKTLVLVGGAVMALAAVLLRGMVPELVRYLKIRSM
jgi:uncharacterized protein DUF6893